MNRFGPKETNIISRLSYEKVTIITNEQLEKLFGQTVLVRQIIYQLKKKGILRPITKGIYYYSPLESGPDGIRINEFLIPPVLFPKENYYVGYSNMYSFYGFTEQVFQTVYVLNTALQRERIICGIPFKLLKISNKRMYGLEKIKIKDTEVVVSNKERTLVDLIYYSNPVGGLKQAFKIFERKVTTNEVDVDKLIKYTKRFPSISTRKRIGYVLDSCGVKRSSLVNLEKSLKKSSLITLYGSKSREGSINKKWKVIIDDS